MDMELAPYAILILVALCGALGFATWRLSQALAALRREHHNLSRIVASQGNDLAGMASAGVHIDRLLVDQALRLSECAERLASIQTEQPSGGAYHGPIERIRNGATAEDLVSEFGLSLSEATLLVRLHADTG
ncbi:MAG: hypothetical protein H6R26_405 [Proteobacteria bacterium]|nr:hypothetical protein [Pseudomonadota bacterium]